MIAIPIQFQASFGVRDNFVLENFGEFLNFGSDHNVSMEIVAANYGDENVGAQLLSGQAQI